MNYIDANILKNVHSRGQNRHHIYRGLDIKTNKWIYGSLVHRNFKDTIPVDEYYIVNEITLAYNQVINESIGEFSGIYDDIDNFPIFEGDIISGNVGVVGMYIADKISLVTWVDGRFIFSFPSHNVFTIEVSPMLPHKSYFNKRIIGNIYENFDKLEEECNKLNEGMPKL